METEEPARKRKKSEKKRKSKLQKISSDELPAAPLPSETENDVSLPPVPMEQSTSSAEIAPLLPPNVNDSGDSELDLSSLMADKLAESANDSVDDCVLPTVPSLADMLSQSDICSSIASAGSSIDDGENISQDGQISSSTLQVVIKSEPKESTYDVMNSGSKSPIVSMCPHASSPISHNHPDKVNDGTSTLLLDDQTIVNESGCETSADQTHMHDQAQLDAHAHELLDSVSGTSIAANESTTKENTDDNLNGEGYTLMSRHILKDVVPKSRYEELPEGWKELVHETGLPLYCHLKTRVVTWSRPYFLADRYAKTHPVPVGAIPCMIYKRCKEMMGSECNTDSKQISHKEKETPNTVDAGNSTQSSVGTSQDVSNPGQSSIEVKAEPVSSETDKVDSRADHVQQSANEQAEDGETCVDDTQPASAFTELDAEAFMDYCKPVFIFEKKEFKKFNSWKKRKEFEKNDKIKKFVQAGEKDSSMSPVVIPVSEVPEQYQRDDKGKLKRDFYSVPGTHTVMDVYMTYTMWLFRKAPFVEYSPSDAGFECQLKSRTPSVLHGIGIGPTKKAAKEAAAINALESLVPQYAKRLLQNTISYNNDLRERTESSLADYYKLFDAMSITDERVVDAAKDTNQIYPLSTLKECIARNFAMDDSAIKVDTTLDRKGRFITIICDMTVGQFSIKGIKGKNIKMATHYASQNILQQLHPHLKSWGSILRLYGAFAEGSSIALKQESKNQLEITQIVSSREEKESKAAHLSEPKDTVCASVLTKLKEQMRKVYKERQKKGLVGKKKFELGSTEMCLPLHNIQMLPSGHVDSSMTSCSGTSMTSGA